MRVLKLILMWILGIVLGVGVIITLIITFPTAPMKYKGDNNFRKDSKAYPFIIPHGGAKDLTPENTVYSYKYLAKHEEYLLDEEIKENMLEFDVPIFEIDLALTKDEVLITHHDLDLDKEVGLDSEGNRYFIRDYTYDQIIQMYVDSDYAVGRAFYDRHPEVFKPSEQYFEEMVPAKMEDVFEMLKDDDYLYILEIKDIIGNKNTTKEWSEKATQILADLVVEYDLVEKVVLSSFSDEVIKQFRETLPNAITNFGVGETSDFALYSALYADFFWKTKSQILIVPNLTSYGDPLPKDLEATLNKLPKFIRNNIVQYDESKEGYVPNFKTKRFLKSAHRKNYAVFFWTINDEDEMRELIDLGVDGIITDRPDLMYQIIEELKNQE